MAELGLPGVKKGKTWVGRHLRDTRNALVVLWRWFGVLSVFRPLRCTWATKSSAESKIGLGRSSPRARVEEGADAEAATARTDGGTRRGGRGQVDAGDLRDPGPLGSARGDAAKELRGSGRPEYQWRREISTAEVLTVGGSGWNSRARRGAEGREGDRCRSWPQGGAPAAALVGGGAVELRDHSGA